jgi:2-C-methyl-D-erythritol 4-phosphate cytidylyltransferase
VRAGAIIVAAGRSTRMGGIDKIVAPLAGRPLLLHALAVFAENATVERIVVVAASERLAEIEALIAVLYLTAGRVRVVAGGARRQDSVLAGLAVLDGCDLVAVHDAARPLLTAAIVAEGLQLAERHGAAVAAWPVADTLKQADAAGRVLRTVPRDGLWAIQTPQTFRRDLLVAAHAATSDDVTDDAMLVEAYGQPVQLYRGSPHNFKVTTAEDLALAEALLTLRR